MPYLFANNRFYDIYIFFFRERYVCLALTRSPRSRTGRRTRFVLFVPQPEPVFFLFAPRVGRAGHRPFFFA